VGEGDGKWREEREGGNTRTVREGEKEEWRAGTH
jgi:hypothetical protein